MTENLMKSKDSASNAVDRNLSAIKAWDTENGDELFDMLMFLSLACERAGVKMSSIITPHDIPTSRDAGPFHSNARVWGVDKHGYAVYGSTHQHIAHIRELPR